jgi:hypothetical protein
LHVVWSFWKVGYSLDDRTSGRERLSNVRLNGESRKHEEGVG